jgi:hypothetical protein
LDGDSLEWSLGLLQRYALNLKSKLALPKGEAIVW